MQPFRARARRHGRLEGHGIRRLHDGQAGHGPHQGQVLQGHVGAAVEGGGDAGVRTHQDNLQARVVGGQEELVVGAAAGEAAEGGGEGPLADGCQARSHADEVGLGHAHVEEAVRDRPWRRVRCRWPGPGRPPPRRSVCRRRPGEVRVWAYTARISRSATTGLLSVERLEGGGQVGRPEGRVVALGLALRGRGRPWP